MRLIKDCWVIIYSYLSTVDLVNLWLANPRLPVLSDPNSSLWQINFTNNISSYPEDLHGKNYRHAIYGFVAGLRGRKRKVGEMFEYCCRWGAYKYIYNNLHIFNGMIKYEYEDRDIFGDYYPQKPTYEITPKKYIEYMKYGYKGIIGMLFNFENTHGKALSFDERSEIINYYIKQYNTDILSVFLEGEFWKYRNAINIAIGKIVEHIDMYDQKKDKRDKKLLKYLLGFEYRSPSDYSFYIFNRSDIRFHIRSLTYKYYYMNYIKRFGYLATWKAQSLTEIISNYNKIKISFSIIKSVPFPVPWWSKSYHFTKYTIFFSLAILYYVIQGLTTALFSIPYYFCEINHKSRLLDTTKLSTLCGFYIISFLLNSIFYDLTSWSFLFQLFFFFAIREIAYLINIFYVLSKTNIHQILLPFYPSSILS